MTQTVGQYLGTTKGPVINQHDVSDDYRANFPCEPLTFERYLEFAEPDETFPEWKERMKRGT